MSVLDSPLFLRDLAHEPTLIVRGEGVYLFDSNGKRYLDGASGAAVASLGHGNTELAELIGSQAATIAYAHPAKFVSESAIELARKLVHRAPKNLSHAYFTSGGSESTEAAIKMARQYHLAKGRKEKFKILSRRLSYHGATLGALSVTGQNKRREPYLPLLMCQPSVASAYRYRCELCQDEDGCNYSCASDLERAILEENADTVSAFIAEPILGSSAPGCYPPDGYWSEIRQICDRHDVLLIADEVMSGNGRSGKWWAMQHTDVSPDIIITAKGIGAGYTPLGALLVSGELYRQFRTLGGFRHGHTYAGNPVSCAVGAKVIDIIERDNLLDNVSNMGERLQKRLWEAVGEHPNVGDIRGRGLLLGIELVADKHTKRAYSESMKIQTRFSYACLDNGLYVYQGGGTVDGKDGEHMLIAPPFIITEQQVEEIVHAISAALEQIDWQVAE